MAKFYTFCKSGALKGSTVYDISKKNKVYPYITANEAWEKLSDLLNLSGINEDEQDAAKNILQGRLRYVFGFVQTLASHLKEVTASNLTQEKKNSMFLQALEKHANEIWDYIDDRLEHILKTLAKKPYGQTLKNRCKSVYWMHYLMSIILVYRHIAAVLKQSCTTETPTFSIKEFQHKFVMSPEDTGFLLFAEGSDGRQWSNQLVTN